MDVNAHLKTIVIWLVVIAAVVIGYQIFSTASGTRKPLDQSEFYRFVKDGDIEEVTITGDQVGYEITGTFKTPLTGQAGQTIRSFSTYIVKDEELPKQLSEQGVIVKAEKPRETAS